MRCNICGSSNFGPAPANRLSLKGNAPLCVKCRSLERHRAGRYLAEKADVEAHFSGANSLTLGAANMVPKSWFGSHSSVDVISATDVLSVAPEGHFSFISAMNLLEKVESPSKTLALILRVLSDDGLVFLFISNMMRREKTNDWGFADSNKGNSFRVFGRDFESALANLGPDVFVMVASVQDPVTGDQEWVYVICKSVVRLRQFIKLDIDLRILG